MTAYTQADMDLFVENRTNVRALRERVQGGEELSREQIILLLFSYEMFIQGNIVGAREQGLTE